VAPTWSRSVLSSGPVTEFRIVAGAAIAAVLYVLLFPVSASASSFHAESDAYEFSGNTGMYSVHVTQAVSGQESTGCSAPYSGNPVYETEWIIFTSNGQNWDEMGVGHQCNDGYRYIYWGYGYNNVWYSLGTITGTSNGTTHNYKITRAYTGSQYDDFWYLDGTLKSQVYSPTVGYEDSVGLESYSSPASVNYYASYSLQYQHNEGAWTNWSGFDASGTGTHMCGIWDSATSWSAAENQCGS